MPVAEIVAQLGLDPRAVLVRAGHKLLSHDALLEDHWSTIDIVPKGLGGSGRGVRFGPDPGLTNSPDNKKTDGGRSPNSKLTSHKPSGSNPKGTLDLDGTTPLSKLESSLETQKIGSLKIDSTYVLFDETFCLPVLLKLAGQ